MSKLLIFYFATFTCLSKVNDPFSSSYERDKVTVKAIAICHSNKKCSAICEFRNKTYLVNPGDTIEHFEIQKIEEDNVELQNKRTKRVSKIKIS